MTAMSPGLIRETTFFVRRSTRATPVWAFARLIGRRSALLVLDAAVLRPPSSRGRRPTRVASLSDRCGADRPRVLGEGRALEQLARERRGAPARSAGEHPSELRDPV